MDTSIRCNQYDKRKHYLCVNVKLPYSFALLFPGPCMYLLLCNVSVTCMWHCNNISPTDLAVERYKPFSGFM